MIRPRLAALALLAALGAGLPAVAQTPAPTPAATEQDAEKSAFVRFVEDQISTPDRRIRLDRIDGALSSDVRIGAITIADRRGVWLEIADAHLVWSRLALLKGRLEIDSLEAGAIRVSRKPEASSTPSATASPTFALPDLPVAVRIGRLAVPDVDLAADVAGTAARFSVDGAARLESTALDARLAVHRLDAAGRIDFRLAYAEASRKLDLDLTLDEPNGGFLGTLLDIRGRPALALTVRGSAPIDAFAADLALDADGTRLVTGRGTVTGTAGSRRVALTANGSLGRLASERWGAYFAGRSSLDVVASQTADGGVALERAEIVSGAASLRATGALAADGFPTALTVAAELGGADGAVPVPGTGGRARRAALTVAYDEKAPWRATVHLEDFRGEGTVLPAAEIVAGGTARDLADPKTRSVTFQVDGRLDGLSIDGSSAFRSPLRVAGRGLWRAGAATAVDRFAVEDGNTAATFQGTIGANAVAGRWRIAAKDLAPLSGLAGRRLGGAVELGATGAWHPVGGAFDLTFDGASTDLVAGLGAADALLRGRTTLRGRVARSTEGLLVDAFALDGASLEARAGGTLGRTTGDLTLSAAIRDVAVATPRAKGGVALEARLSGRLERPTVSARLTAPSLALQGRTLRQGSARFEGTLGAGTVDGRLTLDGDLAGRRLEGGATITALPDGGERVDALHLVAGRSRIDGALTLSAAGLADGSIRIAAPDLADFAPLLLMSAQGSVDAVATLSSAGGLQTATAKGTARNVAVEGTRVASADFDLSADDLLGRPAVAGRLAANRIAAGPASVAAVTAKATTGSDRVTRFEVQASGIAAEPLKTAGLGAASATVTGSLQDRTVRFEARAQVAGGIALTAAGTTTVDASDLAVAVKGTVPLAAGNGLLRDRAAKLSGTATLDLTVAGSAAAPRLGGTVTVAGAGVSDPETGFRLSRGSGRIRLADGKATIETFGATTGSAGTISVSGSIGIPPTEGLPADLSIRLARAHVTNGDLLTAEVSGLLTVRGPLAAGPTIGGTITVDRAEISIPERFAGRTAVLDTKHLSPSPAVARTLARVRRSDGRKSSKSAAGFVLALSVEAPARVFVRGRGLDAELGGRVRLDGPVDRLAPVGAFEMRRGRLDVVGQRVDFTRGTVTLVGSLDPDIDFTAESTRGSITVTVRVYGKASDPRIALTSSEDLPQDEVLARFLFGQSITQLSPAQVIRLTVAVAQLAGGGQANDLVGKIRKSTGLDDLDIVTDAQGNAAVRAGSYVTENVYLGVTTGAKGDAEGTINLDITRNLKARGAAGTESSKLGIFFEKEY